VIDAALFWLLALAIGIAGLPFAAFLFARLPGRGLAMARPLGLLLAAYPLWLLASTGLIDYARWSALAALGLLAAAAVFAWRRRPPFARDDAPTLRLWLVGEAVFTLAFFGWLLLHSFAPDVWQTEKPMDMAIVNAINRSDAFPPHDPWLAGTSLNYYYLGHFLVALLVRAAGVAPEVGFNLAVPLFFALSAGAVYAVASTLTLSWASGRPPAAAARTAVLTGLAALALAMLVGNLAGAVQLFEHPVALSHYDWWSPSRVIDGTANEFPFFSFLLADLHAHVMAVPFALAVLLFSLQLAVAGPRRPSASFAAGAMELLLGGLVLGALYAINSLDYPTAAVIGSLALLLWMLAARGRGWAAAWCAAWLGASVLLFLPFWTHFDPATHGLALVTDHAHFSRFIADVGLIYGLPLWILVAAFAHRLSLPFRYLAWAAVAATVVLVLLAPPRLGGLALFLTLSAFSLFVAFSSTSAATGQRPHSFLWLLIGVGLGLVAIGELVYVRDAFEGTPSYRFNTVFKSGYQAWFLLAIAAACTLARSNERLRGRSRLLWQGGVAVLLLLATVYPVAASVSRSDGFAQSPTLDGLRWLERRSAGDVASIKWLRASVGGAPTVLEAVGPDFDPAGGGRVSTFTGFPAVVNWLGHEKQWGHDRLLARDAAVRRIYSTADTGTAAALLRRYGVRYVFVGSVERRLYPRWALTKFDSLGTPVFRSGGAVVYRVGRAAK